MIPYEIFFDRLETDSGETLADDITMPDRKTKNLDLKKAENGRLNHFILVSGRVCIINGKLSLMLRYNRLEEVQFYHCRRIGNYEGQASCNGTENKRHKKLSI
jgi:hypothetical protein